ncbi:MAG: SIMPL domain-containing protein [Myxococcaceae bacterium]
MTQEIGLARQAGMHLALLCVFLAAADVSLVNERPSIHVTGSAQVAAAPDKVDVFVFVSTEESTPEAAMRENESRMATLMSATKSAAIAGPDVQLTSVNISQREEYDQGGRRTGTKYLVRKDLVLCLRTPAKLDALLIELVKGKVSVSRIDFASEALKSAAEQLPVKAMEDARARAVKMAAAVNAVVGRALRVQTSRGAQGNRGMETYSTGGGTFLGGASTGALSAAWEVEVDFELVDPPSKK